MYRDTGGILYWIFLRKALWLQNIVGFNIVELEDSVLTENGFFSFFFLDLA